MVSGLSWCLFFVGSGKPGRGILSAGVPLYGTIALDGPPGPGGSRVDLPAGGYEDAAQLGGACQGFVASTPDFQLNWSEAIGPIGLRAESDAATMMVIYGPDRVGYQPGPAWHGGADPSPIPVGIPLPTPQSFAPVSLRLSQMPAAAIVAGRCMPATPRATFGSDWSRAGIFCHRNGDHFGTHYPHLGLIRLDCRHHGGDTPPVDPRAHAPDTTLPPTFGFGRLAAGIQPDPHRQQLLAGAVCRPPASVGAAPGMSRTLQISRCNIRAAARS